MSADDELDKHYEAQRKLEDYFETAEFRLRHAKQHLRIIAEALNALEREGWELREADFRSVAANSAPFGHNAIKSMVGLPETLTIVYDVNTHEWKSDAQ